MNRLVKILYISLLTSIFTCGSLANAINFNEYRNNIYFDQEVVIDMDFSGKIETQYFFRLTNVGGLEGKLKKDLISMPISLESGPTCKTRDSEKNRFPLIREGNNWILKFPPEPLNWDPGGTYDMFIFCNKSSPQWEFTENGFYILKIEEVIYPFNNDYFDKAHLIVKLPDDFWHNTELMSASPWPQNIFNDNGRLVLEFSKGEIVKNKKIIVPVITVKKISIGI